MNTKVILAALIGSAFFFHITFAQTNNKYEKPANMKHHNRTGKKKIDEKDVPKVVTESFTKIYPVIGVNDWYTFPYYWDYEPDTNAYIVEYDNPEFYEVDYMVDGMPTRAVLSKSGKHINTSKSVKFADLPSPVQESFKNGYYKGWRVIDHETEEVTKPETMEKTYKIVAELQDERKVLHYDANGKQIQGKKIKTKMKR